MTGDKDFEETSKLHDVVTSKGKSLEIIEESSKKATVGVPVKPLTRRCLGKEIVEDSSVPHKKIELVMKSVSGEALKPHQTLVESENPVGEEVFSISKAGSAVKGYLD